MFENLFKKKSAPKLINTHEADVVLRLMFEIAISDGSLDKAELGMSEKRANDMADTEEKESDSIKKITDENQDSVSVNRSVKIIKETH